MKLRHSIVTSCGLVATSVLILFGSCLGQERVESIADILKKAHVSGSLVYWSTAGCGADGSRYPSFPKLLPINYSGSPLDALHDMFADDPKMGITQESGGIIRMAEADVPHDFLDVKIHHVSFSLPRVGRVWFTGPNMALQAILLTPEVQAFKSAHNIGPFSGFRLPGNATSDRPQVHGELNDVTVTEALDYVLQMFPGYWIYGNCTNTGGDREVFFWFFPETRP
jgi:hypothetical protein